MAAEVYADVAVCSEADLGIVQHVRPNRGPHKKGAPQKHKKIQFLQHGNKPEILK